MLENFTTLFKKVGKKEQADKSKDAAKERLHLVLMQDRANVSADFLDMMKQEIVDVIKKYIDVDETDMDVKLENRVNNDGTSGAPALYANIPIVGINEEKKKESEELRKSKGAEEKTDEEKVEPKAKTTRKKTVSAKKATTKTTKTTATTKTASKTTKATTTRRTKKVKDDENNMEDNLNTEKDIKEEIKIEDGADDKKVAEVSTKNNTAIEE